MEKTNFGSIKFEDTIHCSFFSSCCYNENEWTKLSDSINKSIISLSSNYIWNRDDFRVCSPICFDSKDDTLTHLTSITCFGDNIEDEWFIIYLVLEITKLQTDLIVHIEDNDGYFLLIEAADYLPSWLKPDVAENRVFIYQNKVHIIPPDVCDLKKKLTINDAVKIIIANPQLTEADTCIQNVIHKRVEDYPRRVQNNFHKAILKVPLELAAILTLNPSLISPIVNSYCNHDVLEEKLFREVPYVDCVPLQVKFTKYLYAMLLNSKPVKNLKHFKELENNKSSQLGLKLTCGYKIIENQSSKDIFSSPEYFKFLSSLTKNGYFKENIEGSNEYMQLLDKAKLYFNNAECPINTHICNQVSNLKQLENFEDVKKALLLNTDINMSEDDDDWLNVSSEQLNLLLNNRYGETVQMNESDFKSPNQITSALTNFLKKTSDFEGIERPAEDLAGEEDNKIEFDCEQFANCIDKFLNIVTSNQEPEDSDFSDYSDDMSNDDIDQVIDAEVGIKLQTSLKKDNETIVKNLVESMKEEGTTGPSSNVFKAIGLNKTDLLDSDDDE